MWFKANKLHEDLDGMMVSKQLRSTEHELGAFTSLNIHIKGSDAEVHFRPDGDLITGCRVNKLSATRTCLPRDSQTY